MARPLRVEPVNGISSTSSTRGRFADTYVRGLPFADDIVYHILDE